MRVHRWAINLYGVGWILSGLEEEGGRDRFSSISGVAKAEHYKTLKNVNTKVVSKQEQNLMLWPAFTNDVLDCLSNLAAFSDDYTFDNSVEIEWDPSIDWSRHVLCLFNYFLLSRDGSVLLQIDVDHENGGLKLNEDFLVTNQVKFVRASPTGMT